MTPTKRGISRRVERIEGAEDEQTPAEWAAEYVDRQIASADAFEVVDAEAAEEPADSDTVLIRIDENGHYLNEWRARPEEIPDRFDVDDFPV